MSESTVKDFTSGNVISQLWTLAWPIMLNVFFYTLYNIVDTFWVSKIGDEAMAAVGISQITLMAMVSLSMGISIGSAVVMSMNLGAKNPKEAERVLAQGFVLSTLLGIFFTTLALLFKSQILSASGAIGNIFDPAMQYFTITAAGIVLLFYLINIMLVFNSEGNTLTATKLFAISTGINIVLDPIMIFGKFGIPAMGIQGAAYATLISQTVFILLAMRILSSKKRSIRFKFEQLSLKIESVKKVFDIGIPAALTQVINPIGLAVLMSFVSAKFYEEGAAAFSLIFRVEFFAYLPAIAFGMAAMSMIGQNMGAGNYGRANDIFKKASLLGFATATGIGILLIVLGKFVVGAFTQDPLVTQYTFSYLWIVTGTYGFVALSMVISSTFQATGKSWPGFWLMFIKFFILSIPLSYLFTQKLDGSLWTMWLIIAVSNIVVAIIGYIWNQKNFKKTLQKISVL